MIKSSNSKPYDLEERTFQFAKNEAVELKKILSAIVSNSE